MSMKMGVIRNCTVLNNTVGLFILTILKNGTNCQFPLKLSVQDVEG